MMAKAKRQIRAPSSRVKMRARPDLMVSLFFQVDSVLDQIEHQGEIDTINGVPVYKYIDGKYWELIPDFGGFIEAFAMKQSRYRTYNTTPLKQLLHRLEYDAPITELEIKSARKSLEQIRKTVQNMTLKEVAELVKDAQIKFAFERKFLEETK